MGHQLDSPGLEEDEDEGCDGETHIEQMEY